MASLLLTYHQIVSLKIFLTHVENSTSRLKLLTIRTPTHSQLWYGRQIMFCFIVAISRTKHFTFSIIVLTQEAFRHTKRQLKKKLLPA